MKKTKWERQDLINELHSKVILIDMKGKIFQTICSLLDDQMYTKNDAVFSLLDVLALIELEERSVNSDGVRNSLKTGNESKN